MRHSISLAFAGVLASACSTASASDSAPAVTRTGPHPVMRQYAPAEAPATSVAAPSGHDRARAPMAFDPVAFCTSPGMDGIPRSPVWVQTCLDRR